MVMATYPVNDPVRKCHFDEGHGSAAQPGQWMHLMPGYLQSERARPAEGLRGNPAEVAASSEKNLLCENTDHEL